MNLARFTNRGFDRGAPRWKEAAWLLVKMLFFQTIIPWPSSFRTTLLRLFGAQIGVGVIIRANVNISFPWRLHIGDHVWIGEEVMILSLATVQIESDVCVSQRAFLCTGSHDYRKETFDLVTRGIILRSGSWVAAQSFIGPGVEVGKQSVVGAGSVVIRSVPEFCMVKGNPAAVAREPINHDEAFPGTAKEAWK